MHVQVRGRLAETINLRSPDMERGNKAAINKPESLAVFKPTDTKNGELFTFPVKEMEEIASYRLCFSYPSFIQVNPLYSRIRWDSLFAKFSALEDVSR